MIPDDGWQSREFTTRQKIADLRGILIFALIVGTGLAALALLSIWAFAAGFIAFILLAHALPPRLKRLVRTLHDRNRRSLTDEEMEERFMEACAFVGAWLSRHTPGTDRQIGLHVGLSESHGGSLVQIRTLIREGPDPVEGPRDRILPRPALKVLREILDPAGDPRWLPNNPISYELMRVETFRFSSFSAHDQIKALARVAEAEADLTVAERHDPILACGKGPRPKDTLSFA